MSIDGRSPSTGATMWTDGAVAELRGLLPSDHVLFNELALRGAALVPEGSRDHELGVTVPIDARSTTPVGFVLAFGPRVAELGARAGVGLADVDGERAFERARSAELEVLRVKTRALDSGAANSPNGAPAAEAPR